MNMNKQCNYQHLKSRIKQGDEVIVIAGKDKGKQGVVKRLVKKDGRLRLLVEGVNLVKKHVKPNPNKGEQGGIITKEASIDISNVKIFNSTTGKADKVGYRVAEGSRKARCFKSTGELIDSKE